MTQHSIGEMVLVAVLGAGETRTEAYQQYAEGALERITTHSSKSVGRVLALPEQ